jgi:DNA recombination protein RmuC
MPRSGYPAMQLLFAFAAGLVVGIVTFWLVARLVRQTESVKTKEIELLTSNMRDSVKAVTSDIITGGVKQLNDAARDSLSRYTADNQAGLETKKGLIDQSLETMNAKLERVSLLVNELEKTRAEKYGELSKQLIVASAATTKLSDSADALRGILSNPTARGQWGERLAEDVLRAAGLVEGVNYRKQFTMRSGCRPDFTFDLPNGLILNMDVKFPLTSYQAWFECTSENEKKACADQFKRDVQTAIKQVYQRGYIDATEDTVDYAILFVPNERVLGFLNEFDPSAIDVALKNKVVICSPFTLYAVLVVVRQAMDNFKFAQTTSDIVRLHGDFNKEWSTFKESFDKIKRSIDGVQEAFEILSTTRRRKLDSVLEKIDALRGQERAEADVLPASSEDSRV